ncbi:LOW QUALITY PROTEIN: protein KATNIP homolog [Glandiceps talaboti]
MDRYQRKNWDKGGGEMRLPPNQGISIPKEDVSPAYDDYLLLLQQRNRLMKRLKKKDDKQIELEKREQGFALYVNGANANNRTTPASTRSKPTKTPRSGAKTPYSSRKPKTAGDIPRPYKQDYYEYFYEDDDSVDNFRAKTAPTKVQRRNWQQASIEIKTSKGDKRKIHAPTQKNQDSEYSEDFEVFDSLEVDDYFQSDNSDLEYDDDDGTDDTEDEQDKTFVMMSIDDVKKLRQSLELNCEIHDSIAKYRNEKPGQFVATISEEDEIEEIEEDILDIVDSLEVDDLIVLELANTPRDKPMEKMSSNRMRRSQETEYSVLESNTSRNPKGLKQNVKLTAQTKSTKETEIVDADTSAVIAAMRAENEAIQQQISNPSKLDIQVDRSTESLNSTLTEDRLDTIVKKISTMDARSQHQLFETLSVIEASTSPTAKAPTQQSFTGNNIVIQLLSNWGHPTRIGLTEVQFFDKNGQKISIDDSEIDVVNAREEKGDVSNIVNGKSKTTKERNMWSCNLASKSVQIVFQLPSQTSQPSQVNIWNYNRTASELNVGAKDVCIMVNGQEMWRGELDKGCGNQVFDYSKGIQLDSDSHMVQEEDDHSAPQLTYRKATPTKDEQIIPPISQAEDVVTPTKHTRPKSKKEKKEKVLEMFGGKKTPQGKKEKRSKTPRSKTPRKMAAQLSANQSSDTSTSTSDSIHSSSESIPKETLSQDIATIKIPKSSMAAASPDEPSMLQQLMQFKSKRGGTPKSRGDKPSWLKTTPDRDIDLSEDFKSLDLSSIIKDSLGNKDDRPSSRRSAKQVEEEEWSAGLIYPKKQQDRLSDMAESSLTTRAKWRQNQDLSLEESWSSLSFFDKSHRGRLANMNLDVQGDALDKYISQTKMKSTDTIKEEVEEEEDEDDGDSDFEIPELPFGQHIDINIQSTWGDKHYVGLNGIEIFQSSGEPIKVTQITADPSDINILDDYCSDPRVVTNLVDGINITKDDIHMWLAPFQPDRNHMIYLTLEKPARIAMIRIWNYNKSRIHSFRGAKDVDITLDGRCIFKGEIARASGGILGQTDSFGDTILFTTDDDILEAMSRYDETYEAEEIFSARTHDIERPPTADEDDMRPFTSAEVLPPKQLNDSLDFAIDDIITSTADGKTPRGQYLKLHFTETWGDPHYLGLTGLEVLDKQGDVININLDQIDAHPRDLNDLPDYHNDERTLDKLIDGMNVTMTDQHMWLIPFLEGEEHSISINLDEPIEVSGLRIWNYNKSPEDTYRGAKVVHVTLDNHVMSPSEGFLIRKDLVTASLTLPRS